MSVHFNAAADKLFRTTNLPSPGNVTVCQWVRVLSTPTNDNAIWSLDDGGGFQVMEIASGTLNLSLLDQGNSIAMATLALGAWYFVAYTSNGTTNNTYVIPLATGVTEHHSGAAAVTQVTPGDLFIGGDGFGDAPTSLDLWGTFIWNTVKSQTEIEAIARAGAPGDLTNINGVYMLGTSAAKLTDSSGLGRTLSAAASTWEDDSDPPITVPVSGPGDTLLYAGEANPNDVRLYPPFVWGAAAAQFDAMAGSASGSFVSTITGTGAANLDAMTGAAAAAHGAAGTASATLAAMTGAASGSSVTGTGAATFAAMAGAATGSEVTGTASSLLATMTGSAAGAHGVAGTASTSLAAMTGAAAGSSVTGSASASLANMTGAAAGAVGVAGAASTTLATMAGAAAGSSTRGTAAAALANMTGAAAAAHGVAGTASAALATMTGAAAGSFVGSVTGSGAATLGAMAGSSTASSVAGSASAALAGSTGAATGSAFGVGVSAAGAATFAPMTGSAAGRPIDFTANTFAAGYTRAVFDSGSSTMAEMSGGSSTSAPVTSSGQTTAPTSGSSTHAEVIP